MGRYKKERSGHYFSEVMPALNIRRGAVRQLPRFTKGPLVGSLPKTTHVNAAINRFAPHTPIAARNTIALHATGVRPVTLRGPFARAALGTRVNRALGTRINSQVKRRP